MFCDYSMSVKLNEMGVGTFQLKYRNAGFQEKKERKIYTAVGSYCR